MKFRRRVFSSSFSFLVLADRDGVSAAGRRNVYVGAVFLRAGRRNKAACRMADRNTGRSEEDIDRRRRAAEEGIDYCSAAELAADIAAEVVEAAEADVDIAAAYRNIPALREVYILSAYCGCHYYFCLYFCLP